MLLDRVARSGAPEREGGLPWVLPVVVYNGSEPWTAAGQATDLVPLKFGTGTAERLTGLLEGVANPEDLDKVGDWILECGSELLSRVSSLLSDRPG